MKHLLLITLFLNIFIATSQAQGIGFFIEEDSIILNLKFDRKNPDRIRKETINVKIKIENNTNNVITLKKQTDFSSLFNIPVKLIPNYCEEFNFGGEFRKFILTEDNEWLQEIDYLPMDYVYYTKSGKLKITRGGDMPSFKTNRAFRKQLKQRKRQNNTSIAPNESLTYNVNIYMGDNRFEKNKTYYLVLVYKESLSQICFESNRLKVVTR